MPNRRWVLPGLGVMAVAMLAAVIGVMSMDEPLLTDDEAFPNPVIIDPHKRPDIVFPDSVRTYDLSLNCFVDRFARVCMQGRYDDLRLLLSTRSGDPIVAKRFESMFNAIKQVHILALEQVRGLPNSEGPVYVLKAEYVLEDFAATKSRQIETVRLAIAKEDDAWRIGPIPRGWADALAPEPEAGVTSTVEGLPVVRVPPTAGDSAMPGVSPTSAGRSLTSDVLPGNAVSTTAEALPRVAASSASGAPPPTAGVSRTDGEAPPPVPPPPASQPADAVSMESLGVVANRPASVD